MQQLFKQFPKPHLHTKVCVIVPVRNEADTLADTLTALRGQTDALGNLLEENDYEVLLLVNNSTDRSYDIALEYAERYPSFNLYVENVTLKAADANIGTVRRLLMDEAHHRLCAVNPDSGIIASTDGDTVVDSKWICNIMQEISDGADAVGGRILTENCKTAGRAYHLRDVTYRCLLSQVEALIDPLAHDPLPRHFQYFGASMAVTCKMYEQAGRLPIVPYLEDMAFHQSLTKHDAKVRKSFKVKVYTSSRTNGRVAVGFSEQLQKWKNDEAANKAQMVETVGQLLIMFSYRARLRKCWQLYQSEAYIDQEEIFNLAMQLKLNKLWLLNQINSAIYFGQLWQSIELRTNARSKKDIRFQTIHVAIMQLREFISMHKPIASQTNPVYNFLPVDGVSA